MKKVYFFLVLMSLASCSSWKAPATRAIASADQLEKIQGMYKVEKGQPDYCNIGEVIISAGGSLFDLEAQRNRRLFEYEISFINLGPAIVDTGERSLNKLSLAEFKDKSLKVFKKTCQGDFLCLGKIEYILTNQIDFTEDRMILHGSVQKATKKLSLELGNEKDNIKCSYKLMMDY
jgi:hypothetical protein